MAGWNLKEGVLSNKVVGDNDYWSMFNFIFSDQCRKRNTYKFGIIKSVIDNIISCTSTNNYEITYEKLFSKFTENYWNIILRYDLRQMRRDGKSELSKIESIIYSFARNSDMSAFVEYEKISPQEKHMLVSKVANECKVYVLGALYNDTDGLFYGFNVSNDKIKLNKGIVQFILKYKSQLEKLNYYCWAKYLETINPIDKISGIITKLELATPKRKNLSVYRDILLKLGETDCFYCKKDLSSNNIHVDHYIPWSFVHDDKLWNLVLSCSNCNLHKNDKICVDKLDDILYRNRLFLKDNSLREFMLDYEEEEYKKLLYYAVNQGYKRV